MDREGGGVYTRAPWTLTEGTLWVTEGLGTAGAERFALASRVELAA
jgi:hypothetical protein